MLLDNLLKITRNNTVLNSSIHEYYEFYKSQIIILYNQIYR